MTSAPVPFPLAHSACFSNRRPFSGFVKKDYVIHEGRGLERNKGRPSFNRVVVLFRFNEDKSVKSTRCYFSFTIDSNFFDGVIPVGQTFERQATSELRVVNFLTNLVLGETDIGEALLVFLTKRPITKLAGKNRWHFLSNSNQETRRKLPA